MSKQQSNDGNESSEDAGASYTTSGPQGQQSIEIGVGRRTSGEAGAMPGHETMAETGGSGGDALTQPRDIETAPLPGNRQAADDGHGRKRQAEVPEGAGTAATAITRGYQDTRSRQASPGSTGLGEPETGGNQDEADLAPPRP
jgi:hypothetical protein